MSQSILQTAKLFSEIAKIQQQTRQDIASIISIAHDRSHVRLMTETMQGIARATLHHQKLLSAALSSVDLAQRNAMREIAETTFSYQRVLGEISRAAQVAVQRASREISLSQKIVMEHLRFPDLDTIQQASIGTILSDLSRELVAIDYESVEVSSLDQSTTQLIEDFSEELAQVNSLEQLSKFVASIQERVKALEKPDRKTVLLIFFMTIWGWFQTGANTWWTSYVRDSRSHLIEYRQSVDALRTLTQYDPSFSVEEVSGVIRTPCTAVRNHEGVLQQTKMAVGTLVKITKRSGKSIEIHWYESEDTPCSGWINIKHVRFPKRFR